jgi:probable selenium-dependent hydroxylase accessory protein YqeC
MARTKRHGLNAARVDAALLDALAARKGLVCLVGAGGKKTLLYRLAALHPGRVGITATSHIERFPRALSATVLIDTEDTLLEQILAAGPVQAIAFAQPSEKRGRYAGLSPSKIGEICSAAGFDACYIKADGARNHLLKAPNLDEPPIPAGTHTVIPVLSARALGSLASDRIIHRLECFMAVTGVKAGEPITPSHIAQLLASDRGALKNVGGALVVPVINMVDNRERETLAREAAEQVLTLTQRFDRIVLTILRSTQPIVDIVYRR